MKIGSKSYRIALLAVLSFVILTWAVEYNPKMPGGWYQEADLNSRRFLHGSVNLADGRVLSTGGTNATGGPALTSAEIYDATTNTWTSTGSMNVGRMSMGIVLLNDGRVLVSGGRLAYGGGTTLITNKAEIFDPATGVWTLTGSMNYARRNHQMTLLSDGRVLVTGGGDRASLGSSIALKTAEIYDPATGAFTYIGDMTTPRLFHGADLLPDGTVLLTGGTLVGITNPQSSAEIYDPAANTFTYIGNMNSVRNTHAHMLLNNGKVLIAGGGLTGTTTTATAELYDPATRTFTSIKSMPSIRGNLFSVVKLYDGSVLIPGGANSLGILKDCFLYDPYMNNWTITASLKEGGDTAGYNLLPDGRVLRNGGLSYDLNRVPTIQVEKLTQTYVAPVDRQIIGLRNVINGLPSTSFNNGEASRELLIVKLNNISKFVGLHEEEYSSGSGAFLGHTINNNGVYHRPGLHYPETYCTGCHGADLTGGVTAPSCYTCHGAKWSTGGPYVDYGKALLETKNMLNKLDGCGTEPDSNDAIIDCNEQKRVRSILQVLIDTLDKMSQPNALPTVSVSATPTSGVIPLNVTFTSTASDSDGSIATYFWDFGDSTTSSEINPVHSFACPGTFNVSLTVTDNLGGTASATVLINVASDGSGIVRFKCDVVPVLDPNCLGCHSGSGALGGLDVSTVSKIYQGGASGPAVIPFDADNSLLITRIIDGTMPPGGSITPTQLQTIKDWINQGALSN
ncbi:MAG: PKD domain-containing protein [Candidatus Schekmanbacteria bacterium]|nr:PKD domain-containing protein [Candidatus Schekmanbacteria bacterium]